LDVWKNIEVFIKKVKENHTPFGVVAVVVVVIL